MPTCCVCGRPTTYDAPHDWCDLHWILWWFSHMPGREPLLPAAERSIRSAWRRYGKPKDAAVQLAELRRLVGRRDRYRARKHATYVATKERHT